MSIAASRKRKSWRGIFDELRSVREKISANAGFASYRDFAFKQRERFDYSVDDCLRFHEGVEAAVVPLAKRMDELRARDLGVPELRPWDLSVDPLNRPPLKPFTQASELVEGCLKIAGRVDARFGEFIRTMRDHGTAEPGEPKGKGSRRLPVHSHGGATAFHFHERGWVGRRCADTPA